MTSNDSQDLTPEQRAHYGSAVRALSTKTEPVYCPKTNNPNALFSFWIIVNMAYQAELSEIFEETSDV